MRHPGDLSVCGVVVRLACRFRAPVIPRDGIPPRLWRNPVREAFPHAWRLGNASRTAAEGRAEPLRALRAHISIARWANFGSSPQFDKEMVKEGKKHRNAYRYAALNFTFQTIEVRIFNSSIRTDRFYKNLEACQAAFDFSKAYGLCDMTTEKFIAFIVSHRSVYPNLAAFLVERNIYLTAGAGEPQMVVKQLFNRAARLRKASGM